ncbi:TRAP transporter small permease subunit [Aquibacillus halophilus]|uniref:TRAP transporter small permease subunit n=1 Tax=Aquibacillus halophilus TaxID=930132 RepID=A0A6A8DEM8_9BACI|nr:TRAP transporter small permease [Aquibacillus halophilus]MRH44034.1 TRAP transporter small permease subunit [Aquibacillus halophilus]
MNILNFIDKTIMKLEEFILSFAIILISIMTVGNVIAREVFNSGILSFNLEVSKFAVVIATFMGIAYAARKGRHISMSAFYDFGSFKIRKIMMIVINGLTAIVLFVLTYFSGVFVISEYQNGAVTTALQVPQYLMVIFIPIGFFMGGIQFIRNMWINITDKEKVYIGIDAEDYNDKDKREIADEIHL